MSFVEVTEGECGPARKMSDLILEEGPVLERLHEGEADVMKSTRFGKVFLWSFLFVM